MSDKAKTGSLVILGIDGMDYDLTLSLLPRLPNLKKLAEAGGFAPFPSVFPPDSIPAWITAYTGSDPSEHGVLESVNYFAKGSDRLKVDTSAFQGRTFWDIAGAQDRSVCVINPFMAYPVWHVNGLMVNGPVFITGEVQVSDPVRLGDIALPLSLGGIVDFPNRKTMLGFVEKIFADTREQGRFGRALLSRDKPDLFFQVFLTMDRIQHFLWRHGDRDDPDHPGPNRFERAIIDFYVAIDEEIGAFLRLLDPGDRLMVISDHGHGRRCTHCFNINEYLRRRGDVVSSAKSPLSPMRLIETLKNATLGLMDRLGLQDHFRTIARFVPGVRQLKKGKHLTNNTRNRAYVSDFTGTNPFGGICINRNLTPDYDQFRETLMRELAALTFRDEPVFLWLKKREELPQGKHRERFPDILFEMQPDLGVNWSLHGELFTRNPTHKALSGGHKRTGVFFSNDPTLAKRSPSVRTFFRLVLNTLRIVPS